MKYTPLYDELLAVPELTLLEAVILCRVRRWGAQGCFESNKTLAGLFKTHPRTIQRTILGLKKRGWLAIYYLTKQQRIMYFSYPEQSFGPLFENSQSNRKISQPTAQCRGGVAFHPQTYGVTPPYQ